MRISDWSSDVCSSDLSCSLIEGAATAADLQPAERAMVDALRHWVAAYRRQEDALGAARTHFEQQFNAPGALWGDRRSGDDAGLSLHSVLRNTTLDRKSTRLNSSH